jgi:PAS domain-containing protein
MIDITDSRLQAAEYEGVVYAIRQALAVVEFDMDGHILTANDSFLALTGYRLDELQGRHHSVLCQPEEAASAAYQTFWSDLRAGRFQTGEFLRTGKDGRRGVDSGGVQPDSGSGRQALQSGEAGQRRDQPQAHGAGPDGRARPRRAGLCRQRHVPGQYEP